MESIKTSGDPSPHIVVEITTCPDCGAEWEVVVTEHPAHRERD